MQSFTSPYRCVFRCCFYSSCSTRQMLAVTDRHCIILSESESNLDWSNTQVTIQRDNCPMDLNCLLRQKPLGPLILIHLFWFLHSSLPPFTDQIVVAECISTSNTKCECKPGTFCLPDEPCEVCKKCSKWVSHFLWNMHFPFELCSAAQHPDESRQIWNSHLLFS